MKASTPKIIIICGPTCCGKTSVAISLAEIFGGQIVGADSMQIYRYMDIGTAKPTPSEQARVIHHLIDIVTPDENFNAVRYAETAGRIIRDLSERGLIPFVVGGTGLYIKALLKGLFQAEKGDPAVRERLKSEAEINGVYVLYDRLQKIDAAAARKIHPNDTYRIIRALEVYETTGRTISTFQQKHNFEEKRFEALKIGLEMDRKMLYDRINRRVDNMLAAGLLAEVRALLEQGYAKNLKAMQSIGYRHMIDFLEGRQSREETVRIFKRDTRRYAKRQLTWFRQDPEIHWIAPENREKLQRIIRRFLSEAS